MHTMNESLLTELIRIKIKHPRKNNKINIIIIIIQFDEKYYFDIKRTFAFFKTISYNS